MIILSHRGFWRSLDEKNAAVAFERTIQEGFGTETDVRDCGGVLVVAHDMATPASCPWSEVVNRFEGTGLPLAVNVKADGLSDLLVKAFAGSHIDWFAFDMSGPETLKYARAGVPFFTRHSDIERDPLLYDAAAGVWLDAFEGVWFSGEVIARHLAVDKRVCVVSCELHGRDPVGLWQLLADLPIEARGSELMLCTDRPDEAKSYFRL